jgi:hypothetical protein
MKRLAFLVPGSNIDQLSSLKCLGVSLGASSRSWESGIKLTTNLSRHLLPDSLILLFYTVHFRNRKSSYFQGNRPLLACSGLILHGASSVVCPDFLFLLVHILSINLAMYILTFGLRVVVSK